MTYVGKAKNLKKLLMLNGITVPHFIVLTPHESERACRERISAFLANRGNQKVAVRSSAAKEDSAQASFAGMYSTKLHVPATLDTVWEAVLTVKQSEAEKGTVVEQYSQHHNLNDSKRLMDVIVQDMIDADLSGVIFSHDLNVADGYYTVSVSEGVGEYIVGGSTNGVLIRVARGARTASIQPEWLGQVIHAMKLVEDHFESTSLDVEFAIQDDTLYILQCRPLTTNAAREKLDDSRLLDSIAQVTRELEEIHQSDVLGDMIDINPVELLGTSPTTLDISIFNHLFGERTVERVRRRMGYDPLDCGLIKVVAGKPYTSLIASAYSLRPHGVPASIYDRIVKVYRESLIKNPALQTQVEFSLYAMRTGKKLDQVMKDARLTADEKSVTISAFTRVETNIAKLSAELSASFSDFVSKYEERTDALSGSPLEVILEHVTHGTEFFVALARLAFYWKNQFEETYPDVDLNELIAGQVQSPATDLHSALLAHKAGKLSRGEVLHQYGHLRPGQFSVLGEAYEDDPETYLFGIKVTALEDGYIPPEHPAQETETFQYVVSFMRAREEMKFLFSRSLHLFAIQLKQLLAERGISHANASALTWEQLNAGKCTTDDELSGLPSILLPEVLIPGISNLHVITYSQAQPTYITNATVKAEVCVIEQEGLRADVQDKIVLLPNADPGYDFLFHSGAKAIVTKVGGPASHMCIRATELQMPACIGCGEQMYQKLVDAQRVVLDCSTQQMIIP